MKRKAKISLIVTGVTLVLLTGFIASVFLPAKQPAPAPLPNPNAFDYFIRAEKQSVRSGDADRMFRTDGRKWTLAEKRQVMADNKTALATFRTGLAYEYAVPLPKHELIPTNKLRSLARLVRRDGLVAAENKEWGHAANAYIDVIQLGQKIGGTLAGPSIEASGKQYLWDAIDHLNASESHAALNRLEALAAKRLSFPELLQEDASNTETYMNEQVRQAKKDILKKDNLVFLLSRGNIVHQLHKEDGQLLANLQKPFSERSKFEVKYPDYSSTEILELIHLTLVSNLTSDALIRTRLALRAYLLEKGAYPLDLNALVDTGYLKSVPMDPFFPGQSLHYRLDGTKYLLYSVAADGKDDNGKIIDNPNPKYKSQRHEVLADSKGDYQGVTE